MNEEARGEQCSDIFVDDRTLLWRGDGKLHELGPLRTEVRVDATGRRVHLHRTRRGFSVLSLNRFGSIQGLSRHLEDRLAMKLGRLASAPRLWLSSLRTPWLH